MSGQALVCWLRLYVFVLLSGSSWCFRSSSRMMPRAGSSLLFAEQANRMGGNMLLDKFVEKFTNYDKKAAEAPPSESDRMLAAIKTEPWRADKIKNLPVVYRSTKDSWKERYFNASDDTVYLYSIPGFKPLPERTRVDELWNWPWMWSKVKAERLAWLHKIFYADVASMTVQEHMEMDALLSEFDMPVRWGLLRMKEIDVLNAGFLNLCFFTDFTAVKPTDLGLRPDGSVKTCPVQFHNCISSSNRPSDTDHYAPPFRWSRDKSPDQAYDEIKNVYMNYPKRGLKWSSGWIDRGGWHPQQFSGPYFYAEAESLAFHYADDIELVLDVEKREVQYRSSTRLGAVDWDVERLRYNQFCRMLNKFGGWYTEPLPRLQWLARTPYHWTELALDKTQRAAGSGLDALASALPGVVGGAGGEGGAASRALDQLTSYVYPYLQPALGAAQSAGGEVLLEPRVAAAVQVLQEWREKVDGLAAVSEQEVQAYVDKVIKLLPERLQGFATGERREEEVESEKVNSMDLPLSLPARDSDPSSLPSGPADLRATTDAASDAAAAEAGAGPEGADGADGVSGPVQAAPWRAAKPLPRAAPAEVVPPSNPVESLVLKADALRSQMQGRQGSRGGGGSVDLTPMETKVLKQQLETLRESLYPKKIVRVF